MIRFASDVYAISAPSAVIDGRQLSPNRSAPVYDVLISVIESVGAVVDGVEAATVGEAATTRTMGSAAAKRGRHGASEAVVAGTLPAGGRRADSLRRPEPFANPTEDNSGTLARLDE